MLLPGRRPRSPAARCSRPEAHAPRPANRTALWARSASQTPGLGPASRGWPRLPAAGPSPRPLAPPSSQTPSPPPFLFLNRRVPASSPDSSHCYGIGRVLSVGAAGTLIPRGACTPKNQALLGAFFSFFLFFGLDCAEGGSGGRAARADSRPREGPSGGPWGSPAAGAWCSRRGRCQGSAGGPWSPRAAAAAEAAVSAARPGPPAPPPRGPPEVSDSHSASPPRRVRVCVSGGVPLPPCPAQPPRPHTPVRLQNCPPRRQLHPRVSSPPFPIKPGVLVCCLASSSA